MSLLLNRVECKVCYVSSPVDGVIGLIDMQYLLTQEYLREVKVGCLIATRARKSHQFDLGSLDLKADAHLFELAGLGL